MPRPEVWVVTAAAGRAGRAMLAVGGLVVRWPAWRIRAPIARVMSALTASAPAPCRVLVLSRCSEVCCGVDIDVLLVGPRGWRAAGCGSLSELGAGTATAVV